MHAWLMAQNLLKDTWENGLKKSEEKMGQMAFFDIKITFHEGNNS